MDKFSRMNAHVNFSRGFIFANKARLKNQIICQIILDFIVTNMPMMNKSKVTKNCHFSINVSSFGPKMVVISFFGITQRQEIQTTSLLGTIYNTESEEKVYEPRQKKKKVTEKNVFVKKNNNVENVFSIISPRVFRFIQFLTIF